MTANESPGGVGTVLGVGIDLVEVGRIRTTLGRTAGFASRVYTEGERRRADKARDPAERYAVRWAAKEAVLKALGVGLAVPMRSIEVVLDERQAPSVRLHDRAAELAKQRGISGWHLSLTHTATTAGAVAVAFG